MIDSIKQFYKKVGFILIFVFLLRCFLFNDNILSEFELLFNGGEIIKAVYKIAEYISESITFTGLVVFFYEKYLWRFNPFEKTPKLTKHYVGTVSSTHDNNSHPARLEIQQTLLTIQITFYTNESRSLSINATFAPLNGETCLIYNYVNTPIALVRDRSSIHNGTAILCIRDGSLSGNYFTDRKSTGFLKFNPANK